MEINRSIIFWPELHYGNWKDTLDALHMKMQVAGKVKLALTPFLNQWWNAAFHLSARGINSGLMFYKNILFEINFDFISNTVSIQTNDGQKKPLSLSGCSVSEFYK